MPIYYVFLSQFCMVYLLGMQSLNVRDGRYVGAAITSALLGVFGFILTSTIGSKEAADLFTVFGFTFVVAGPLAIMAAMATHPKLIKLIYGEVDESKKEGCRS